MKLLFVSSSGDYIVNYFNDYFGGERVINLLLDINKTEKDFIDYLIDIEEGGTIDVNLEVYESNVNIQDLEKLRKFLTPSDGCHRWVFGESEVI